MERDEKKNSTLLRQHSFCAVSRLTSKTWFRRTYSADSRAVLDTPRCRKYCSWWCAPILWQSVPDFGTFWTGCSTSPVQQTKFQRNLDFFASFRLFFSPIIFAFSTLPGTRPIPDAFVSTTTQFSSCRPTFLSATLPAYLARSGISIRASSRWNIRHIEQKTLVIQTVGCR